MKPIFEEELDLLRKNFNIEIPTNCWKKKGGWILAPTGEGLINIGRLNSKFGGEITFTPSNRNLKSDIIPHFDYCNKNQEYKHKILDLSFLKDKNILCLTSTGKDSEVAYDILFKQLGERERVFTNTSMDVAPTLQLA